MLGSRIDPIASHRIAWIVEFVKAPSINHRSRNFSIRSVSELDTAHCRGD